MNKHELYLPYKNLGKENFISFSQFWTRRVFCWRASGCWEISLIISRNICWFSLKTIRKDYQILYITIWLSIPMPFHNSLQNCIPRKEVALSKPYSQKYNSLYISVNCKQLYKSCNRCDIHWLLSMCLWHTPALLIVFKVISFFISCSHC